jgi:hypothetical protein
MDYARAAASALHAPGPYLEGVLGNGAAVQEGRP